MIIRSLVLVLLALPLLMPVAALAQEETPTTTAPAPGNLPPAGITPPQPIPGMDQQVPADPYAAANNAAIARMHIDMLGKPSGNPDLDYVRSMIAHHKGAIDMSEVIKRYGTDPEVRALADQVIQSQENEIDLLKKWLKDHD